VLLNTLGYKARLKLIPTVSGIGPYFDHVLDSRNRAQMGFYGWVSDFPSDTGFLQPLFSCAAFVAGDLHRNQDPSEFCDPAVDRMLAAAERAQAENPAAAAALWQRVERAILRQAPLVPTVNPQNISFVAKRVRNFQYHPQWGVLLDQLWLR
jgi:peptide/nickel transport system substrate-binding protein